MQIGGAFAESEASGCYGNAARSWNDGINIYMIAAECAEFICAGERTAGSALGAANLGLLMRKLFGKGTHEACRGGCKPLLRCERFHTPPVWGRDAGLEIRRFDGSC
jgi:hypothetical protein